MTPHLNPLVAHSNLMQLLVEFGTKVVEAGLEKDLITLVQIRASQINGCAVCLDMHNREARKNGESDERLYMLDAWRGATLYTERERAALAWTEALTLVASTRAPDDVYAQVRANFSDEESIELTMAINVINCFNRLGVGYRIGPMAKPGRSVA
jgi:AhpD family alkylhydroperoxidase